MKIPTDGPDGREAPKYEPKNEEKTKQFKLIIWLLPKWKLECGTTGGLTPLGQK